MTQGIMFHHFHGKGHAKTLGSIGEEQFRKILKYLRKKYNLISADNFTDKVIKQKLSSNDICLTFDDTLKCQYDIAYPILKKEKLNAFYFIYSSVFDKKLNLMEVFRDFSNRSFKSINDFYNLFFITFEKLQKNKFLKFKKNFKSSYLKDYKFYTILDKKYRYARDIILEKKEYDKILIKMMSQKKYSIKKNYKKLFMNKKQISNLIKNKNIIGLHSHKHLPNLSKINFFQQLKDYQKNYNFIEKNFKIKPLSASYPFGRYNDDTIRIMKNLKIKIAFLSKENIKFSNLAISRIDHSSVLKKIK